MMNDPKLLKEMYAHKARCECGGMIKMGRSKETLKLEPNHCWCFSCGQQYYMEIENIDEWEKEQWRQKLEQK